jgi:hypothetical protein
MKIARKHIGWYLQNWDEQDTIYVRNEIYTAQNPNLAITCLSSLPAA